MNLIKLYNGCFGAENGMEIMYATKLEYNSLEEFSKACIIKQWENEIKNNETSQTLEERLKLYFFKETIINEFEFIKYKIKNIKYVDIEIEKIEKIVLITENYWNSETYALESEYSYYFIECYTMA